MSRGKIPIKSLLASSLSLLASPCKRKAPPTKCKHHEEVSSRVGKLLLYLCKCLVPRRKDTICTSPKCKEKSMNFKYHSNLDPDCAQFYIARSFLPFATSHWLGSLPEAPTGRKKGFCFVKFYFLVNWAIIRPQDGVVGLSIGGNPPLVFWCVTQSSWRVWEDHKGILLLTW